MTLDLTKVRDLTLAKGYLSSASGLVDVSGTLYVVADDELELGTFKGDAPGSLIRAFTGTLPADHKARKAKKPDLEALMRLDDHTLLAVPSGSTSARMTGALIDTTGHSVKHVDFTKLYAAAAKHFKELNIEGAAIVGSRVRLLQRGNGKDGANAFIELDLPKTKQELASARVTDASLLEVKPVTLGTLDGVPLSFTDASPLPDGRMIFSAAAEDSQSTYDDGEVKGSVVGVIEKDGTIGKTWPLKPVIKIEGVHATLLQNGDIALLLVNDADDPTKPAGLYRVTLKP